VPVTRSSLAPTFRPVQRHGHVLHRVRLPRCVCPDARSDVDELGAGGRRARHGEAIRLCGVLTAFGAVAVTFMMLMYALEHRGRAFVAAFACGCALSSVYGFLAGTWPFGIVEAIWSLIALRRYVGLYRDSN
jgi:hypothetical protein